MMEHPVSRRLMWPRVEGWHREWLDGYLRYDSGTSGRLANNAKVGGRILICTVAASRSSPTKTNTQQHVNGNGEASKAQHAQTCVMYLHAGETHQKPSQCPTRLPPHTLTSNASYLRRNGTPCVTRPRSRPGPRTTVGLSARGGGWTHTMRSSHRFSLLVPTRKFQVSYTWNVLTRSSKASTMGGPISSQGAHSS